MRAPIRIFQRLRASSVLAMVAFCMLMLPSVNCAGIINSSPGLRWWLFSNFGAQKVCPEMMKTSVTLRMQDQAPGIGRFFPTGCSYNVNDQAQTLTINLSGMGYAYLPTAKRTGFAITVSVEYRPDFHIAGDDLYVWGKYNRLIAGPNFQLGNVENKLVGMATQMSPVGAGATFLGNQIITSFLTRGFTVVDNSDTGRQFGLGMLYPPQKPFAPVQVSGDNAYTFANETIDVFVNERDYLGPFEVTDNDKLLEMKMNLTGAPVELLIVQKATGDQWLDQYQKGLPLGPPPPPGIVSGTPLGAGPTTKKFKLQPGFYYVVVDNTSAAGMVNPPFSLPNPVFDPSSRLSYVAQLVGQ